MFVMVHTVQENTDRQKNQINGINDDIKSMMIKVNQQVTGIREPTSKESYLLHFIFSVMVTVLQFSVY